MEGSENVGVMLACTATSSLGIQIGGDMGPRLLGKAHGAWRGQVFNRLPDAANTCENGSGTASTPVRNPNDQQGRRGHSCYFFTNIVSTRWETVQQPIKTTPTIPISLPGLFFCKATTKPIGPKRKKGNHPSFLARVLRLLVGAFPLPPQFNPARSRNLEKKSSTRTPSSTSTFTTHSPQSRPHQQPTIASSNSCGNLEAREELKVNRYVEANVRFSLPTGFAAFTSALCRPICSLQDFPPGSVTSSEVQLGLQSLFCVSSLPALGVRKAGTAENRKDPILDECVGVQATQFRRHLPSLIGSF
ncbi:uncharacterized protein BCR38DRAFT_53592 [Pseudomassariella vexata]|uniref:Uncharacterized protein n=1 Tax=Pseudomassariella vexata TaxID=1141098 RepID=A0A1Y2DLG5_9PEZI|nr:uncharacterized protein BCR38DRAFT_53592 [Pseudomassariella vexata]ORY60103.1 hypothetical protein BCR38DRAFT_53592 [Pseudomassariella vexata]